MVLHCLFFFSLTSGTSATRRSFNKKTVQCWITFLMFVAACLAWDNNELTIRQNDAKNTKHQEKGTKKTQLIGTNQLSNTCCLHRTLCKENPDASLPDTKVCVCCIIHTGVGG